MNELSKLTVLEPEDSLDAITLTSEQLTDIINLSSLNEYNEVIQTLKDNEIEYVQY